MRHLGLAVGQCRWPLGPGDAALDAAAAAVVDALAATRG